MDDLSLSTHIDKTKTKKPLEFHKRSIRIHNNDLKSVAFKIPVSPQLDCASIV